MTSRQILILGALAAAAGVGLGAFGAHGLEKNLAAWGYEANLAQRLEWFETGVRYQLLHALGLVATAMVIRQWPEFSTGKAVAIAFLVGLLLFSGSLYAMTVLPDQWKKLGAVVPIGGVGYIAGWLLLALGAFRTRDA